LLPWRRNWLSESKHGGFGHVRSKACPRRDWVRVDAGDIVIHLFRPEVRTFYNLERMWDLTAHPGCVFASSWRAARLGSPEAELVGRYVKRISWPLKVTEPDTGGTIAAALRHAVADVLLDERGRSAVVRRVAELLGRWRTRACAVRFLIGAADGHGDAMRSEADLLIAFGAMTWPHMMARAMLAEQLWRASSILAGHPYHRSG
jgi:23S rRNA (pseudouridine1915-N3)-methyltransferase